MKNKYISLLILIPLFSLTSCNKLIVGSDPLADVKPGEVPEGGEILSIEEVNELFDKTILDFPLKDGLKLSLENSNFKYTNTYTYNNQELSTIYDISNINANIIVDGLKTANSFNDFDASVNFSTDFYTYDGMTEISLNRTNYNANIYLNDGTAYFDLSQSIIDLFNFDYPTSFYLTIPDGFDNDLLEDTGLTYPLFSESNLNLLNNIFNPTDETINIDLTSVLYENVCKVYQYEDDYLLSININKENINECFTKVLDSFYNQNILDLILQHDVLPAEYNELKEQYLATFKEITKDFNHFKASITFDEFFFKNINLDFDMTFNLYQNSHLLKGNFDLLIEYSDDITVTFPSLEKYEEYVKEVTNLLAVHENINNALDNGESYSYKKVYDEIGDCTYKTALFGITTSIWVLNEDGDVFELDELEKDLTENDNNYEVLIVLSSGDNVTSCQYGTLNKEQIKSLIGDNYE